MNILSCRNFRFLKENLFSMRRGIIKLNFNFPAKMCKPGLFANLTPTVVAKQPDILSIPKLYKMQLATDPKILTYSCSITITAYAGCL